MRLPLLWEEGGKKKNAEEKISAMHILCGDKAPQICPARNQQNSPIPGGRQRSHVILIYNICKDRGKDASRYRPRSERKPFRSCPAPYRARVRHLGAGRAVARTRGRAPSERVREKGRNRVSSPSAANSGLSRSPSGSARGCRARGMCRRRERRGRVGRLSEGAPDPAPGHGGVRARRGPQRAPERCVRRRPGTAASFLVKLL